MIWENSLKLFWLIFTEHKLYSSLHSLSQVTPNPNSNLLHSKVYILLWTNEGIMPSGPLLVYTIKPQPHLDSLVSHTFVKGAQLGPVSLKFTTIIANYSSLPRPIQTTATSSYQLPPDVCCTEYHRVSHNLLPPPGLRHTKYHGVSHHLLFFMSRRNGYLIISVCVSWDMYVYTLMCVNVYER